LVKRPHPSGFLCGFGLLEETVEHSTQELLG
jgi:hypothetical protein